MDAKKLMEWYIYVRSILHWAWLCVNELLWREKFFRKTRLKRKIVVVGDETARGFGDWVVCSQTPGYAKFLKSEIGAKTDFKFKWTVQAGGVLGSSTKDWLPGDAGKGYFEENFGEGKGKHDDADLVILHLGAHDKGANPEATAKNLKIISQALVAQGRRVVIQQLTTRTADGRFRSGWILSERNSCIRALFDTKDITPSSHIYLGADLESYKRAELFSFDATHLSSRGYRRVAKETYQVIKNPVINIEWVFLQPQVEERLAQKGFR